MFHIHVQIESWILINNLDCTYYLRVLVFLFFLPLSFSGVSIYLECCRTVCTVDLGDSNFFSTGLPSFAFLPPLLFVYLHLNHLPQNLLFSGLWWLCTDGTLWCPSTQCFWWLVVFGWITYDLWVRGHCLLWSLLSIGHCIAQWTDCT